METLTNIDPRRAANLRAARILSLFVLIGAAAAAAAGLAWRTDRAIGASATSVFGERVALDGVGLYRHDSVSAAAQERAQDAVTLVVALPLLALALLLSRRGRLPGGLLLCGLLGYFLYTYASMCFLSAYNELFLLYVALFSISLFAFVAALSSLDPNRVAAACAPRFPRRSTAAFAIAVALFLSFAWIAGRILPSLSTGKAPLGLEHYTTLTIQVLDLGIIVPAAILSAAWLIRKDPRGYLLGTIILVKGFTLGTAVTAMGINMILKGVADSAIQLGIFGTLALVAATLACLALRSASKGEGARE